MYQLAHASSSSQTLTNGNSSPIYSRNYKTFRNKTDQDDLQSSLSNDDNYLDKYSANLIENNNPNEISINFDYISSTINQTNKNYMHLIDSNTLNDQTLDDNNLDDEKKANCQSNEYFMPNI